VSRAGIAVSRRGLLAIAAAVGVSGCGLSFDDKVANDRYISVIKQDPMFAWVPPGNLPREVSYSPMEGQPLADQYSGVAVAYSVSDAGSIPSLIKLAHDTSLAKGYDEAGKRNAGGVYIRLSIQASSFTQGFSLVFDAPVS